MKKILVNVGISLIFMILLLMGINMIDDRYHKDAIERLEDNIKKAAMNCYSIEGYYPNDVSYLEEKYGVVIDHQRYNVFYEAIASNVFPDIKVFKKV